jgi:hypothetical protein
MRDKGLVQNNTATSPGWKHSRAKGKMGKELKTN